MNILNSLGRSLSVGLSCTELIISAGRLLSLTQTSFIMKKIFFISLATLLFLVSCGDNDADESNYPVTSNDNYYVKYEVQVSKQISYAARTERVITYTDIDKENTITVTNKEWEGTYGPFKKGQTVNLSLSTTTNLNKNASITRISVSKNKEPFVIKAEDRDITSSYLSYTIDF